MDLLELMIFLQSMATDNLRRHEERGDDWYEMGYHMGQLSVLDALIPRMPKGIEPIKPDDDVV